MAMTQDRPTRARGFVSTSPATGEVVGSFPLDGPEQVAAAVARAREAQRGWAPSTLLLANHAASVEYQPLGVVGVIGP